MFPADDQGYWLQTSKQTTETVASKKPPAPEQVSIEEYFK